MNELIYAIFAPIVCSLLCFLFKRLSKWIALMVSLGVLLKAIAVFMGGGMFFQVFSLRMTPLSGGIFLAAALITFLVILYSIRYMEQDERLGEYYGYILLLLGTVAGVLFAADFLTLFFFWGFSGIPLYMLVGMGKENGGEAAKKTLMIVGGADVFLMIGIGLIGLLVKSLQIGFVQIAFDEPLAYFAFFFLIVGVFAKGGVMPLHSWIPAASEAAPIPVMALLPAALDKLLAIYLLLLLCQDVFAIEPNSLVSNVLLTVGSITILAGVVGALFQHNFRKLLSYHAISQIGYMVVGIGTGMPIGFAGALFHMFNNAIYKACLFLCCGAVEQKTGTAELDKLGGLAKFMPITFGAFFIAALSISGIPPFNGFFSKWMIYQALVDYSRVSPFWIVWLLCAMAGSAFTLASFIKLIHALFLGQGKWDAQKIKEANWLMLLPLVLLAGLCVVFGVFAFVLPLRYLIIPAVDAFNYSGSWRPALASALLIAGLMIGLVLYWFSRTREIISKPVFVGGELLDEEKTKVSGINFYDAIRFFRPIALVHSAAAKQYFDLYAISKRIVLRLSGLTGKIQNGFVHAYLGWMLAGTIIVLLVLAR